MKSKSITPTDLVYIITLARAAARIGKEYNLDLQYPVLEASMDLEAAHHACPLQLREMVDALQTAHKGDVVHDLLGIRRHLNRESGKLEGFFTPRYAQSNRSNLTGA